MERVTGIGGVFFKASDPQKLAAWYRDHLGVVLSWEVGAVFKFAEERADATTTWSIFAEKTEYFDPSKKPFMFNFRVKNLDAMLAQLRALGDVVDEKTETSEFGRFGWVMDPDGNRVEIWEPAAGW